MLHSVMRSRFMGSLRLYSTKKKSRAKKIAEAEPPQIMLSADSTESSEDLKQLADFLSRSFLRSGIKSAVHPEFGVGSIQNQLKNIDEMAVNYSLVMKSSTLTDGLLGLRHKESTIPEQVHVSTLKRYLKFILRPQDHSSQ